MRYQSFFFLSQAANPGCLLEDFVRWYSPFDWIPGPETEEEIKELRRLKRRSDKGNEESNSTAVTGRKVDDCLCAQPYQPVRFVTNRQNAHCFKKLFPRCATVTYFPTLGAVLRLPRHTFITPVKSLVVLHPPPPPPPSFPTFNSYYNLHGFPPSAPVTCCPTLGTPCTFSQGRDGGRKAIPLYVYFFRSPPPLNTPATQAIFFYPCLGSRYMVSCAVNSDWLFSTAGSSVTLYYIYQGAGTRDPLHPFFFSYLIISCCHLFSCQQ